MDTPLESNLSIQCGKFKFELKFSFSVYNLTAALYAETETERYSAVVMVVKEKSKFRSFEDLKNAKACFPEYGSIGKSKNLIKIDRQLTKVNFSFGQLHKCRQTE